MPDNRTSAILSAVKGAQQEHHQALPRRATLKEHGEVISVIQEDFAGRVGRERTAAIVIDHALRNDTNLPPRELQSPREVDLLHVGKVVAIESAQAMEQLGTAAEGCTRDPKQVARIVILPVILLYYAQHAPATEGITQEVDIAARSAGILKLFGRYNTAQFRRTSRHVGMLLQALDERLDPATRGFDIGIQQDVIVRLDLLQCPIVPLGKAVIAIQRDQLDHRKIAPEQRHRTIRRAVIGYHDRDTRHPLDRLHDRREETPQVLLAVPVEYDDFSSRHVVYASSGGATTSTTRVRGGSSAPGAAHIVP